MVATTDTLVEGIDFRLDWPGFDFRLLGRRLMSINLSDLAAMGAEPRYALVSLALRGSMPSNDVDRLYAGVAQQAQRFGCLVAGGDFSETGGPLSLTATLIGRVASAARTLRRAGARRGWQIGVTGRLGGAAAGLRLLETRRRPATATERRWVRAQLDPQPRVDAGRALVSAGVRVGGDISDGLYREVQRITEPSRLGATIDVRRLPLASGLNANQWPLGVEDSEDFELLCAAPAAPMASAKAALGRLGVPLTVVGEVEREPGIRLLDGARVVRLRKPGYEHFH